MTELCHGWLARDVRRAAERAHSYSISLTDAELLRRAVRGARCPGRQGEHWRWVAVMEVFALGATYAQALCRRFDLDPDEKVRA